MKGAKHSIIDVWQSSEYASQHEIFPIKKFPEHKKTRTERIEGVVRLQKWQYSVINNQLNLARG